MVDIFLQEPDRLKGKPKNTIADLVEARGISVPQRYASLDDALASGRPIIARSEHPVEYAGPSGLFESFILTEENINHARQWFSERGTEPSVDNITKLKKDDQSSYAYIQAILAQVGERTTPTILAQMTDIQKHLYFPKSFADLTGTDMNQLLSGLSFSFWENLGGLNRVIVADSAIKGRYHLFSTGKVDGRFFHNYSIHDNGKVLIDKIVPLTQEMLDDVPKVIAFYEEVRQMDSFDQNHCPIVEFQTVEGKHYFLQYHRTREFRDAGFFLEREPLDGEVKADFVRGATPSEGLTVNTAFYYRDFVLADEEASFDIHYNLGFTELMARRRMVQFFSGDVEKLALHSACKLHLQKSKVFKPELFVAVDDIKQLFDGDEILSRIYKQTQETGISARIPLHVISDGRTAYVKRK